ncbi:MAG: DNA internalization-related competence protein ComEC/Rec2 [Gammaproteobacteria bacterium]|nr:MAG: DNA internalization-related competence protein ComEC/Rec2 [Gammaproteobacteria bacterium]
MRSNILAFALGAGLLQQQAKLPQAEWVWILLLIALIIGLMRRAANKFSVLCRILSWSLCLGIGFFWAAAVAQWRLSDTLPHSWERQDIQITGVVASVQQETDRGIRFRFDVEQVLTKGARVPRHLALSWFRARQAKTDNRALPVLHPGERWRITVRLKQPHGTMNPHGFDYEAWVLERNIRATGYVHPGAENERLQPMVPWSRYWIEYVREEIQHRFAANLPDRAYTGILQALAIGDQHAIPRDQWQVFTRTGTNHLMAISGLHITMISSMVFAAVFWLWRWSAYLTLRLPAYRAATMAGLLAAIAYAVLSGFAIPAQRTLYMLAVVAVALWQGKQTSATSVLAWALFCVVLFDPWAVIAPGFWLSFGAIALIMLITVGRIGKIHWLTGWLRVQWAITLGLIPLLLVFFQQVPVLSPLANAIAIPLISLIVVPLTLLAAIPLFEFVLPWAHEILSFLMTILRSLSNFPHAVWQQHTPPLWTIAVAAIGILWMLLPGSLGRGFFAGFPARWLGMVAVLPLFWVLPPQPKTGELWLTVLDVGQGLAVVARTEHHALLFDTGPGFADSDSGKRIIVPYLRGEGIRRLHAMVVSHADNDHSGGALSVLDEMPVELLLSSLQDDHPIQRAATDKIQCRAGQSWFWDGVHFEVLHPLAQDYANPQRRINANSCVLKISSIHGSILIPADIENKDEQALLSRAGDKLAATVLIAPHHGSLSSSTAGFVNQVNPALTIFTVGYLNRYDHPRSAVVARYLSVNSRVMRSDGEGAILLRFAENGWSVESWRGLYRRYWHHRTIE